MGTPLQPIIHRQDPAVRPYSCWIIHLQYNNAGQGAPVKSGGLFFCSTALLYCEPALKKYENIQKANNSISRETPCLQHLGALTAYIHLAFRLPLIRYLCPSWIWTGKTPCQAEIHLGVHICSPTKTGPLRALLPVSPPTLPRENQVLASSLLHGAETALLPSQPFYREHLITSQLGLLIEQS